MQQLRQILDTTLKEENSKTAYQLSDGTVGLIEIGEKVGIKKDALSRLWKNWAKIGLGEYISVQRGERFKRSFDLEEVGIEVALPDSKKEKTKNEKEKPKESETLLSTFDVESEPPVLEQDKQVEPIS